MTMCKNNELADMIHQINTDQDCGCSRNDEKEICRILEYIGPQEQKAFARLLIRYWKDIPEALACIPKEIKESAKEEAVRSHIPEQVLCMAWLVFDGPDFDPVMGRTGKGNI